LSGPDNSITKISESGIQIFFEIQSNLWIISEFQRQFQSRETFQH